MRANKGLDNVHETKRDERRERHERHRRERPERQVVTEIFNKWEWRVTRITNTANCTRAVSFATRSAQAHAAAAAAAGGEHCRSECRSECSWAAGQQLFDQGDGGPWMRVDESG